MVFLKQNDAWRSSWGHLSDFQAFSAFAQASPVVPQMQIHQLSLAYHDKEDRLLWLVNTTDQCEVKFWLTRRLTSHLLPQLPQVLADQIAMCAPLETPLYSDLYKSLFSDLHRQELLRQSDFSKPYKSGGLSLVGEDPLLVTEISLMPRKEGQTWLKIREDLSGREERALEMQMAPLLLQGFHHLLCEILPKTGWELRTATATDTPQAGQIPPLGSLLN
jgi:hypothetical protein